VVTRETEYETNDVYRTFDEFCELYSILLKVYPQLKLRDSVSYHKFKELKGHKRRQGIEILLNDITKLQPEISQVII
jgi:hypothetical protein